MSAEQALLPRKYRRPRRYVSWTALILGLALGLGGGLYFAWNLAPLEEFNTSPWQLTTGDQQRYVVAIALSFAQDSDINRAAERLLTIWRPGGQYDNPFGMVAGVACDLARTDFIATNNGRIAIGAMQLLYQSQGFSDCADDIIVAAQINPLATIPPPPTVTPTLVPPASKTPTPPPLPGTPVTPGGRLVPTTLPQQDFALVRLEPYCDQELSGIIEVYVQASNGDGIPGIAVRVRWDGGEDTFFTGLKPERGPAYADFQMEPNRGYIIELPGRSDPSSQQIAALPCTPETGASAIQSYRAVYRPTG